MTNDTFLIQERNLFLDLKEMTEILCEKLQQKHPSSISKVVLGLAFNFSISCILASVSIPATML
jgi:hypothetical protein